MKKILFLLLVIAGIFLLLKVFAPGVIDGVINGDEEDQQSSQENGEDNESNNEDISDNIKNNEEDGDNEDNQDNKSDNEDNNNETSTNDANNSNTNTFSSLSDSDFSQKVQQSTDYAQRWLINNTDGNNLFYYIYNPENNSYASENNAIRQLFASYVLAKLCTSGKSDFCDLHKKNIDYIMNNWYQEKEANGQTIGYIYLNGRAKLGSSAMLLRALSVSVDFDDYSDEAKKVYEGFLYLQKDDGSFDPWLVNPDNSYTDQYLLNFYSGEALLAMMEYYEKTADESVYEAAKKSQDYYIKEYVDNIEKNFFPSYVPWHTMSLAKFYDKTVDKKYAEAIFTMNNKLLDIQDTSTEKGRFYDKSHPEYGQAHSASDAIYTAGLIKAKELAEKTGQPDLANKYNDRIKLSMENLSKLQYCNGKTRGSYDENKVCGAVAYSIDDPRIRIDSVVSIIDAFWQE